MKSYHDFHIYGYEVDSVKRKINFKLAWPEGDGQARIVNVQFDGVFGYELKNDSMASIVYEFEEISLNEFMTEYASDIKEAYRQNGAYGPWAHDLSKAEEELTKDNVKAIVLSSSMGMVGWVLTQTVSEKNA
ncbi:MAG: hypothetical protein OEV64_02870 [Desulfobulbaceae bacterium]|nr:hypothetical protein [Desulfobulbaceae bacterium]